MKFSDVAKGTGEESEARTTVFVHGKEVPVILRPLSALAETDAVADAIAYTKGKKAEPVKDNPIYESALAAANVLRAALDADAPLPNRSPFFESIEEALKLDTDALATLHEQQRILQEKHSPSIRNKTTDELFLLLKEVVERDDPFFYARLAPGTRWLLQLTTGVLLRGAHVLKFWPSSPDSSAGTTPPVAAKAAQATA